MVLLWWIPGRITELFRGGVSLCGSQQSTKTHDQKAPNSTDTEPHTHTYSIMTLSCIISYGIISYYIIQLYILQYAFQYITLCSLVRFLATHRRALPGRTTSTYHRRAPCRRVVGGVPSGIGHCWHQQCMMMFEYVWCIYAHILIYIYILYIYIYTYIYNYIYICIYIYDMI